MGAIMTSAFVTTVGSDRVIKLPPEMPVGTTVAVIAVPSGVAERDETARQARFAATLAAIRQASETGASKAAPSDTDLTAFVERARKAKA